MNGGPSGFHNAPATRTFVIACALLTIILGIRGRSAHLGLSYKDVMQRAGVWKSIASIFTFSSTPELLFGLYLLYYFRLFERQIGSNKYSVFALFSLLTAFLLEVLALIVYRDPTFVLVSGPYSLIFSSFIPFYFDIPISSRLRIFSIPFSDKSFIYMAGFQLLLSSWKRSLVPGICGIFSGSLYRLNAFGIRNIKFPNFIAQFFSRLSRLAPGSLLQRRDNITRSDPTHRNNQTERNFGSSVSSAPEPLESSIATLVSMGFDDISARQALIQARNDVNIATNILIEAQSL